MQITNHKSQITNNTQITNNKSQTDKFDNRARQYDLERRTLEFAKAIIKLCKKIPINLSNRELLKQIVRSGCSVGANYREASEALSKKDFLHRMRISRRECKETSYWLKLMEESNSEYSFDIKANYDESLELRNIFSAIIEKSR